MKIFYVLYFLFTINQVLLAEDKVNQGNRIEELRQHHLQIMEERLAHLELRHKKKIEFENEIYNLEKNHLQEISALEEKISANDKSSNQKIIIEIKQKMRSFQELTRKKTQSFHQAMKKEIEDFKIKTREKVKSLREKK
jgi:hypothetical protein